MQGKIGSNTIALPDSKNGKEILKTENLIKGNNNTILRFGGLIGKERNPLKYLIHKNEILNPEAPINYIHLKDCIGIISAIICKEKWGKTYSAVSPYHPSKKEYYNTLCDRKKINRLKFSAKKTVIKRLNIAGLRNPAQMALCAHVTVAPDSNRISVLSKGTSQGDKTSIPFGG